MTTMFDDTAMRRVADLIPFLTASTVFALKATGPITERATWIRERLIRFQYDKLKRFEKRILRSYLCTVSGLSVRTLKYHITAFVQRKALPGDSPRRHRFVATYTRRDQELLAATDNAHGRMNGSATIAIMAEEHRRGSVEYARLKDISVSHLYNLRSARIYREHAQTYEKTKAVHVSIGERRKPVPDGKPGFLRVDTVHQGDQNGQKGVYHINLVDEALQWQITLSAPQISEAAIQPVLDEALHLFPFIILGFHSDNGSEFINVTVARLLNKLCIAQTKSRARRSTDNGLVESKNGSTIRKHMGHWHIPGGYAARINQFYREHFIPYLNFHRPCAFPTITVDARGKKTITYPKQDYATPYRKLRSLPDWEQYLRPGITPALLEAQENAKTPNQAAQEMQAAKQLLFTIVLSPPSSM